MGQITVRTVREIWCWQMKIGDLVKYDKSLSCLENCMGVIVGVNGQAFEVQWFDRHSQFVLGSEVITSQLPSEKSVEMPEFLEVASENR